MRLAASLLLALTASGCLGLRTVGLEVHAPPVERGTFTRQTTFTPVDSLRPTFRWQPLEAALPEELWLRVHAVTYELRVWQADQEGTRLVYRRADLPAAEHTLGEPLAPARRHFWTVRAWFDLGGRRRATPWALAGKPLEKEAVPNLSCLRFETPEK